MILCIGIMLIMADLSVVSLSTLTKSSLPHSHHCTATEPIVYCLSILSRGILSFWRRVVLAGITALKEAMHQERLKSTWRSLWDPCGSHESSEQLWNENYLPRMRYDVISDILWPGLAQSDREQLSRVEMVGRHRLDGSFFFVIAIPRLQHRSMIVVLAALTVNCFGRNTLSDIINAKQCI